MIAKTLHIYLVKKYIPPFMATLFIAMFIFFMIFVFTYIDEIAGKGVDNITLVKMFGYIFITNLPPSMPLAVLLLPPIFWVRAKAPTVVLLIPKVLL